MNSRRISALLATSLALSFGCTQQRTEVCIQESKAPQARQVINQRADSTQRLEEVGFNFQTRIDAASWEALLKLCDSGKAPKVTFRLREASHLLPIVANYPIKMRHVSQYDKHESYYSVRAPADFRTAEGVVVLLGDETTHRRLFPDENPYWIVSIPPIREVLGYQLLSEGDLMNILTEMHDAYPEIQPLPSILIATGTHIDDGLKLANNHPYLFDGVAISGRLNSIRYPNLDQLPVMYFTGEETYGRLWSGEDLITNLQDRGNRRALLIDTPLDVNLRSLFGWDGLRPAAPLYTFTDYQYSRAYPWLQVLSKQSEHEPCEISGTVEGDTLYLKSKNARALELNCDTKHLFPKGVTTIVFDGEEHEVQPKLILGKMPRRSIAHYKAKHPSTLQNFFKNEPLYVVYDDQSELPGYEETARKLAKRFATLDFVGMPDTDINLPIVPLSVYEPQRFPKHRAIFIGQAEAFTEHATLSTESLSLALDSDTSNALITEARGGLLQDFAFTTVCHPTDNSHLVLSWLVSAPDAPTLLELDQRLSLATTLFSEDDIILWARTPDGLVLAGNERLDGFWGWTQQPAVAVELPRQDSLAWESYLREILISEVQLDTLALPQLMDLSDGAPKRLTSSDIGKYCEDRDLAVVTLEGSRSAEIGTKLINAMGVDMVWGMEDVSESSDDGVVINPTKMRRQVKNLVVDARALSRLSSQERAQIEYHPVGHSLHEIVLQQMNLDPKGFSNGLLRASQE